LDTHNSGVTCEVCPIDTVFFKIADFLKRKSSRNWE
jgi:hypothetical protein